ncbi:MAG: hypothetical protein AAF915_09975 [Cyanobacteria bacterium P01_D01_bin.50]
MAKDTHECLFDALPQTSSSQLNQNPHIVLDPTGLYDIPSGYISITTDVEWIKFFGVSTSSCWVKGKQLCDWAEAWLRSRNRTSEIAEIKQDPRHYLEKLFRPELLPKDWTGEQLLILATRLDSYPQDNPIGYLLADITNSDKNIWFGEASIQNLAAWLTIQVPQECRFLERVWQNRFQKHNLAKYYQTEDKLLILRRWLLIAEPKITDLGKYPLPVPEFLTQEFDQFWEQRLFQTEGKIIDNLIPTEQSGFERIANVTYSVLSNRPKWITKARESKVAGYLSYKQKAELGDCRSPSQPQPLSIDATRQEALTWAIESYLPFRRWETVINQPPSSERFSDRLADSFVEWILKHYPEMKVDSVEDSYLNYSVAQRVQNLCQSTPVLWVVVDGLGWLDHQELISLLTKDCKLAVETAIEPRFSILPTKTEYAKWSLYTQLLPSDSSWVADAGKGFPKMQIGKRYTDGQLNRLYSALKKKTHQLYCWDTDIFDSLYHTQKDWESLYQLERPHALEGIAKKIDYCLQQYPDSEQLRIVIASDHGQMMGILDKITHCPPQLEFKGRMAIGKTDDSRFVVLESDRYGLPHDISVIRNSASFSSFSYTTDKKIIGSHGGLFPEEVVVGVSVLRKSVQRRPVLISCYGEGEPKKSGELEITIDNPNSVPLTDLFLYINELPSFDSGKPLEKTILANKKETFKLTIPEIPELLPDDKNNEFLLSGKLTFIFANTEAGSATLDFDSKIIINQMFSSGFDIDEFL